MFYLKEYVSKIIKSHGMKSRLEKGGFAEIIYKTIVFKCLTGRYGKTLSQIRLCPE